MRRRSPFLDPRNGPEGDLPAPAPSGSARTFVIASLPRTGSTLLGHLLRLTGEVGDPREYLNPMQVRDFEVRFGETTARRLGQRLLRGPAIGLATRGHWNQERLGRYLARVRMRRTGPSGWFGLKLHWHHLRFWFLDRGWPVAEVLGPERWIWIRREDRVAQAVSWARALQTGRWASHQRALLPAVYRPRQISRLLHTIEANERAWQEFFERRGIEPLELIYEELVVAPGPQIAAVLARLGVAASPPKIDGLSHARQGDATNARWIARFQAEAGRPFPRG